MSLTLSVQAIMGTSYTIYKGSSLAKVSDLLIDQGYHISKELDMAFCQGGFTEAEQSSKLLAGEGVQINACPEKENKLNNGKAKMPWVTFGK